MAPNDIALFKLKSPIKFNERVQPVQLPEPDSVQVGEAVLSGWGSISKKLLPKLPQALQTATMPVLENSACEMALKALSPKAELYDTQMCTGTSGSTVSACSVRAC